MDQENVKVGVVGLGYVGLPLLMEFSKHYSCVGFDIDRRRVEELCSNVDKTGEFTADELDVVENLTFTHDATNLKICNFIIVTVPTPVDEFNTPDLSMVKSACDLLGGLIKKGDYVIFESTVYPGVTEDICVPLLEEKSGLTLNIDFYCGYSPERINPGDKQRKLRDIVKVTSGSNKSAADYINSIYNRVITAGTHQASSIKVAEASKVIENIQRDLNIGLMNELSLIFNLMGIDTLEVIAAAATKWNFLPYKPGLVGGHCISVDPYYLTHKAVSLGYHPEVILSARRVNNKIADNVASRIIKLMIENDIQIKGAKILVLGGTFKENCPDFRNSKVFDLVKRLTEFHLTVDLYDPYSNCYPEEGPKREIFLDASPKNGFYDVVILAVGHQHFIDIGAARIKAYGNHNSVFFDLKGVFAKNLSHGRL